MMKRLRDNRGCLTVFLALLTTINLLLVIFVQMPYRLGISSSVFVVVIINVVWLFYCKRIEDKEVSEFKS